LNCIILQSRMAMEMAFEASEMQPRPIVLVGSISPISSCIGERLDTAGARVGKQCGHDGQQRSIQHVQNISDMWKMS